jgi:hypothetical protein
MSSQPALAEQVVANPVASLITWAHAPETFMTKHVKAMSWSSSAPREFGVFNPAYPVLAAHACAVLILDAVQNSLG